MRLLALKQISVNNLHQVAYSTGAASELAHGILPFQTNLFIKSLRHRHQPRLFLSLPGLAIVSRFHKLVP